MNDQDIVKDLSELVQKTTGKSEEESTAILQKFSTEIQKKLLQNVSTLSEIFTSLDNVSHSQPIYLSNIPFTSLCEHHLLPFFGTFDIAVFPKNKMNIGIDVAAARDDWGIYFRIGEAF